MKKTPQLEAWVGQFGDNYTRRNERTDRKASVEGFRRILGGLDIKSILEVGSNVGNSLLSINKLFKRNIKLFAVEPNREAFNKLVAQPLMKLEKAWNCDVFQLPLEDSSVDLVFTAGVLIHIAPVDLGSAVDEIVRVAHKYVLCREYFSHTPVEVFYRDRMDLLFKRDFGAFYLDRFPNLKCIRYGFLWQREFPIFDNVHWWLFEKQQ